MMISTPTEAEALRAEIAALAARMIAEEGADYGSAKRRAAKQLLGNQKIKGDILPDNSQVESEVREYNALFFGDCQPQRLLRLRMLAIELMQKLDKFNPYLVGAVLNGTAGKHSDIHLHLFTDNSKEVAIFLLNLDMQYEVSESLNRRREPMETLSFMFQNEGVHLLIHNHDDLRASPRADRANLATVLQLVERSQAIDAQNQNGI
jgi:hypothetical protein